MKDSHGIKQDANGNMRDANGNHVALAVGGPHDGEWFFTLESKDGDTFVPLRTTQNRPVYRLVEQWDRVGWKWQFIGYDPQEDEG